MECRHCGGRCVPAGGPYREDERRARPLLPRLPEVDPYRIASLAEQMQCGISDHQDRLMGQRRQGDEIRSLGPRCRELRQDVPPVAAEQLQKQHGRP